MATTNIDFRLADESLDLSADTSVQFEINSPLFETDELPGTLAYPFTVPNTPKNRRLLGFPGYLAAWHPRNQLFAGACYLLGVLWRRGQLSVVRATVEGFELSFKTDVGDVSTALNDVQLADLPLPVVPLDLSTTATWPGRAYALPTVANSLFVPEKEVTALGYRGLVNATADGGGYDVAQPVVPMPYLVEVFAAVCRYIGYELAGSFFADPEVQALVLYSNQATDVASGLVKLAQHLPDQSVVEAVLAVRAFFCLCLVFDPVRRQLEVQPLRDVLADAQYVDWSDQAEPTYDWEPNTSAGFWLEQKLDGGDDLSKNAPAADYLFKVGGASEKIEIEASSLTMQRGLVTPTSTAPESLLPVVVQKGNSPALPDEKDNKCALRLLFNRGTRPDASGRAYPLASAEAVTFNGASAGNYSLRWAGDKGLYAVWHKDWLDFLARTETVTRGVRLRVADLLTLDPRRKVLIRHGQGTTLALWKSISVTISQQNGIEVAQIPFYKI